MGLNKQIRHYKNWTQYGHLISYNRLQVADLIILLRIGMWCMEFTWKSFGFMNGAHAGNHYKKLLQNPLTVSLQLNNESPHSEHCPRMAGNSLRKYCTRNNLFFLKNFIPIIAIAVSPQLYAINEQKTLLNWRTRRTKLKQRGVTSKLETHAFHQFSTRVNGDEYY